MIKQAVGDWRRRIPPWVDIHISDLRRFRGPYTGRSQRLARRERAIRDIYRALAKARCCAWEVLVIRLGEPRPRRDALQSLVRMLVCSLAREDLIRLEECRLYRDRLVLALR